MFNYYEMAGDYTLLTEISKSAALFKCMWEFVFSHYVWVSQETSVFSNECTTESAKPSTKIPRKPQQCIYNLALHPQGGAVRVLLKPVFSREPI